MICTDIYKYIHTHGDLFTAYEEKTLRNASIHVTGRGGLLGCQILTIPISLDSQHTDGGRCISSTHGPPSAPQVTLIFCV
jgi:hypothetical protein